MSAEVLRRAATLMRERAEAVRAGAAEPDMWFGPEELVEEFVNGSQHEMGDPQSDAEHIASWHPVVAVAVADWLDALAEFPTFDVEPEYADQIRATITAGILVARAYLGES